MRFLLIFLGLAWIPAGGAASSAAAIRELSPVVFVPMTGKVRR